MNFNLLAIVNRIVAEQGEGILADAKRLFPYFSGYAQNEPKEERVAFGRCIEMGAYYELKRTPAPDERLRVKATLANQINAKTGIDWKHCADALDLLEAVIFKTQQQAYPQQPQYPQQPSYTPQPQYPPQTQYPPQNTSPAGKKTQINKGVWIGIAAAAAIVALVVSYYSNRPSVQPEDTPVTETTSYTPSASDPPSTETAAAPSPSAGAPSSGETTAPPPTAGYSQAHNGTWYEESFPYDPDFALKLNNGKIDSEYFRGTYTTKNNEITITPTHYIGWFFKVFGDYFLMSGIHAFEWYSREQMESLLMNHPLNVFNKPSAKDINEMLDVMYPTETNPIIGGNKFSLSYIDYTYFKPTAQQLQQRQQALDEIARIERFNAQVGEMLRQAWEAGRTQTETVIDTPYGKVSIKFNLDEIIKERYTGNELAAELRSWHGQMGENELNINKYSWRHTSPEGIKGTITHELGHYVSRRTGNTSPVLSGSRSHTVEDISEIEADAFAMRHLGKSSYTAELKLSPIYTQSYIDLVIKRAEEMEREDRENLNRLRNIAGFQPQSKP